MKSKSFDLKRSSVETVKLNKTFDFVGYYKSAAETKSLMKTSESLDKENNSGSHVNVTKREQSPSKKKKKRKSQEPVDISVCTIDGRNINPTGRSSPVGHTVATSTPCARSRTSKLDLKVKSIMKNSATSMDDSMEGSSTDTPTFKSKKRNKSVSFMLDDTEETATKKTKSNESLGVSPKSGKTKSKGKDTEKKKLKKFKKSSEAEKENKTNMDMNQNTEVPNKKSKSKLDKSKSVTDMPMDSASETPSEKTQERKKKLKKIRKRTKSEDSVEPTENDSNNNEDSPEHKPKKFKKKKRVKATSAGTTEGEPATKLKKEVVPEVIAEDLENLRIGDNAHTLTNLLDEMTVVDKDKKKKTKIRRKKEKVSKPGNLSGSETPDLEKIEEGKEKIKWKKRKWNKDKKGNVDDDILITSIVVENLPLSIMCSYKNLLADHFGKLGLIKRIGIAETYPSEDSKPVFTTTIIFYSEGAALKALEEDNTLLSGSRIRVKRPLPPTETTLVVRSYADLTEQSVSSVFSSAGRIRSIRHLVKGKKAMATAFIEFDGPEAVERAIKLAEDAKIGGKKIHVSKFELRASKRKENKKKNADSENEGDSEDSND